MDTQNFREIKEAYCGFTKTFSLAVFFGDYKELEQLRDKIQDLLHSQGVNLKYSRGLHASFSKGDDYSDRTFVTKARVYMHHDPDPLPIEELEEEIARWTHKGSNWLLEMIDTFYVNTDVYDPLAGHGRVVLPRLLANKGCVINIDSPDGMCLMRALMFLLNPEAYYPHPERYQKYKLDDMPILKAAVIAYKDIHSLAKVEEAAGVGINVYGWEGKATFISQTKLDRCVSVLLYEDHYLPITRLPALVKDKHSTNSYVLCEKCLQRFKKAVPPNHACIHGKVRVSFPKNPVLKFKNTYRAQRHPNVLYADTEAIVVKEQKQLGDNTVGTTVHKMVSFSICDLNKGLESYFGLDAPEVFLESLQRRANALPKAEKLERGQCSCGRKTLLFKLDGKTGCKRCIDDSLYVFMHNFRGYDSHFLIKHAPKSAKPIAQGPEKFMALDWGRIRFRDSFQFLPGSLDALASSLTHFPFVDKYSSHPDLAKKKGSFPYEWFNDIRKLRCKLPCPMCFESSLREIDCRKEHANATKAFEAMGARNMRDYTQFYMETDTLLLADIFEQFRDSTLENYGLDAAYYYSMSNLTWDALLKHSRMRLKLFQFDDKYRFIRKQMRGGICHVGLRHAKANNPTCEDYDPTKPTTWIKYFDINNLYGAGMSFSMPYCLSGWDNPAKWNVDRILKMNGSPGCVFEVDVDYPDELHDLHNDYLLFPEKMCTSSYLGGKDTVPKLVGNLLPKKGYVVDYKMLQFGLRHGLVLRKIHRVLRYNQKPWMKSYIDKNTEIRKNAPKGIRQDVPKLANNACYGKTCENKEQRLCMLISDEKKHKKCVKSPRYRGCVIVDKGKTVDSMTPKEILLDKPSYIGAAVLDNSKLIMYQWWYDFWLPKFPKSKLIYTDTDSIIVQVEDPDIEASLQKWKDDFDTSNYPKDHPLFSSTNAKVIGKMKSETGVVPIHEVVAIRPKVYCVKTAEETIRKAKGVKKSVTKKLEMGDYLKAMDGVVGRTEQTYLHSFGHTIRGIRVNKKTLAQHDTKRHEVGIETFAIGHRSMCDTS